MSEFLLGVLLPLLLAGTGAFFLIYLKGYPFRDPKGLLRSIFQKTRPDGIPPRQALLTALAGTLGVGNISGVAIAVTAGGAGALFWMWVCALFSMVLKYAEIIPAMQKKVKGHGGAMYYMKGKLAPTLFCLTALACGFAMGNMTQVCASAEAVCLQMPLLCPWIAPAFAFLLYLVLHRGKRGVFAFAERAVPIMTLFYCLLCIFYLSLHQNNIPSALRSVLTDAFSLRSAGGGILGSSMILSLRYGIARGLISNEAGCGTAPIAHAACQNDPTSQGCLGMAEVFIDTVLLCTLTALCVLVSPANGGQGGTALVIGIFQNAFGFWTGCILSACLVLFAFATAVCWFYYCSECIHYLTKSNRYEKALALVFSASCLLAPFVGEGRLFKASDLLICLLVFLHLPALIQNRRSIRSFTLSRFQPKKEKDCP